MKIIIANIYVYDDRYQTSNNTHATFYTMESCLKETLRFICGLKNYEHIIKLEIEEAFTNKTKEN